MKIVFMGTPEFSVPCLERLVSNGHDVVGVFSQPDKPKGRGHKLQLTPVKETALKYNIPVFQPEKMRDGEALKILKQISPELIIVIAYGKILPEEIINLPKYGCVNLHASLLPRYRGAAPIQWCVLNGEKETGVTSMQMDVGLDTGDMLLQRKIAIGDDETSGELHDRLAVLSADVMADTINQILENALKPIKQDDKLSNYAPMLSKELCPIDWNENAQTIHNKVRGLSPWPVATTELDGRHLKIHKCNVGEKCNGKPGEIINTDKTISACCGDSVSINISVLQTEGKRAMDSAEFLRGNHVEVGKLLK